MKLLVDYLRVHTLVWLIPAVLVPLVLFAIYYLAQGQAQTPDSPFIYDI